MLMQESTRVEENAYLALRQQQPKLLEGIEEAIAAGATPEMISQRILQAGAKRPLIDLALLAARHLAKLREDK